MTREENQTLCLALAEAIREASSAGRLIGWDALLAELRARGLPGAEDSGDMNLETLLPELLANHPDLAALTSITGETLYHAPSLLSRTYAGILDRKTSPDLLIAEEVRKSSADYPRPLPLELFEHPPFDLDPEQIESSLRTMAGSAEFGDISFVTTSSGAVYLFSSRYLERPYAAFLAERSDTGLQQNP